MRQSLRFVYVLAIALLLFVSPVLADTYTVTSIENSNGTGPCSGGGTISSNAPVSVSLTCGPLGGNISASAVSTPGHAGVSALLTPGSGTVDIATFSTMVVFSSTGPNAPHNPISAALNLAINGGYSIDLPGETDWVATAQIGGTQRVYTSNDADGIICINGCLRDMFFTSGGENFNSPFSENVHGILTTPLVDGIALDTLVFVSFSMRVDAAGNVSSNFLDSLDFPKGSDVFTLPDGYTANSTDGFLVNNRFTSPNTPVPEPASVFLFGMGLAGALAKLRRRLFR